jgi:hypothetical protein
MREEQQGQSNTDDFGWLLWNHIGNNGTSDENMEGCSIKKKYTTPAVEILVEKYRLYS